ncbi:hypothetical protein C7476_111110 [Phyllobacterium bourgognense]|uniref:Uncharacterized protein n=1 Tax=Phyllobacterium bourgognense TaxID=314236 RepID=A0A368YNX3_9HYPH|nr:hypothetical protein C7476_111110 [Phyllobacterium bourgognense]
MSRLCQVCRLSVLRKSHNGSSGTALGDCIEWVCGSIPLKACKFRYEFPANHPNWVASPSL